MRKVWILGVLLILIGSCKQEEQNFTIKDDEMINILVDLHIAEEMVNKFRMDQRDSARALYLEEISQIHNHSQEEINKNVTVLQTNPEKAFNIYQAVYKKLDEFGKKNTKKEKEKKEKEKKEEGINEAEKKDSTSTK